MRSEIPTPTDVKKDDPPLGLIGRFCGPRDRYELKELVTEMPKVQIYNAHDDKLDREVTLTIFASGEDRLAQEQMKIFASFQHPSVSPLFDATKIDDRHVHVLRRVEGYRLNELINDETGLVAEEIFNFIPQLLDVLITLHDLEYLHLGLDPASVLLSNGWNTGYRYMISNFTNACKMDEKGAWSKPQPGMFRDCFSHSAPEVLNGGTADVRSDLFSLGSVIYQSFCGKAAYQGDSPIEISSSHQKDKPDHLGYFRPEIPVELADWVMSLIAIEPKDRPATALDALKAFTEMTEPIAEEMSESSRVA